MTHKKLKLGMVILASLVLSLSCKETTKKEHTEADTKIPENVTEAKELMVIGDEITYAVGDTKMNGYIAYDKNSVEKRPGIIVIHEWWGHNEYVRQRAKMLAELGYTAIAIDMYGDGKQAAHPDDAGKFSKNVMSNIDEAEARFNKAMEVLKEHPTVDAAKIAAIGYCFGGSVALTMANSGADIDAVAAFHSGVALPVMPNEKLKAKVLVCNGADDGFISKESIEAFTSQMDAIGADYQYISYEGAQHSFTSKDADAIGEKFNLPLSYNKDADEKSWTSLQELLVDVFKNE